MVDFGVVGDLVSQAYHHPGDFYQSAEQAMNPARLVQNEYHAATHPMDTLYAATGGNTSRPALGTSGYVQNTIPVAGGPIRAGVSKFVPTDQIIAQQEAADRAKRHAAQQASTDTSFNALANELLGPAPRPLDALQLQTIASQLVAPFRQSALDNASQMAASLKAQGQPPEVVNQYTSMSNNVANAFAAQAMAFPQIAQLNATYDRMTKERELRNTLLQQLFANRLAGGGGSSSLTDAALGTSSQGNG